jgi:hypothetical protein
MKRIFFIRILILYTAFSFSQDSIIWNSNKNHIKIPFELSHNLIIIDVVFNEVKLKMIADTGADESILFSLPSNDSIFLKETELIKIKGVGKNDLIDAYLAKKNTLTIKRIKNVDFDILIVPNQQIDIVNITGIQINGILGASFFEPFLVEIDYVSKHIILHKNSEKSKRKLEKFQNAPIILENRKPYINIPVDMEDQPRKLKLLLDTGMADGLWLFENDTIKCNDNYFVDILGFGLSGVVSGKRSKVKEIILSNYIIQNALVSYPDKEYYDGLRISNGRNGSLGGLFLKRFNWFFDYKNNVVYFKKNKLYDQPFEYNMSGVEIQHKGSQWVKYEVTALDRKNNEVDKVINLYEKVVDYKYVLKPIYEIYAVREYSPAFKAGLKEGDQVIKINGKKAINLKIDYFNDLFTSEEGKEITIVVDRKGRYITFKFQLEKVL